MPKKPKVIALSSLANGQYGLSRAKAEALIEAATVCLDHHQHASGIDLEVSGSYTARHPLEFSAPSTEAKRANADLQEAVEDGATAIAMAAVVRLTEYRVLERAIKKTGFDWWLGRRDGVFEARLEISGILDGPKKIQSRVNAKLDQMSPTDSTGLPGYAAVVEFSTPEARIVEKS